MSNGKQATMQNNDIRTQAFEEAAQAVEKLKTRSRSLKVLQGYGDARREAAAAIRALSYTPATLEPIAGNKETQDQVASILLQFGNDKQKAEALAYASSRPVVDAPFQDRVKPWMLACFGGEITADKVERCDRFIEEALELVQAIGYSSDRAHALVDYVFGRPVGDPHQEVGGVMITVAALCLASGLDMDAAGEDELDRIWVNIEKIRAKRAAKPTGSALPVALPASPEGQRHD